MKLLALLGIFLNIFAKDTFVDIHNAYMVFTNKDKDAIVYMDIVNNTDKTLKLIDVKSNISTLTQLFVNSELPGGMKISAKVDEIILSKNTTLFLSPKKYYIKFIDLKKPLKNTKKIKFTLYFNNEKNKIVEVKL
jgi:copper(I)-binding protein